MQSKWEALRAPPQHCVCVCVCVCPVCLLACGGLGLAGSGSRIKEASEEEVVSPGW